MSSHSCNTPQESLQRTEPLQGPGGGGRAELVAGKYRVLRRLASGGMGEVHLAAQVGPAGFQRLVVLKRILPRLELEPEVVELFLDEARLLAQLGHRNICQIVELGEEDRGYFVAMEFVKGTSVQALLEKLRKTGTRLPPYFALEVACQVADALDYAHSATGADGQPLQLVHRDISPQNVLLSTSGDVKLIDFGVAKSSQQEHLSQSGMVKGKLAYLSPEQSRGQPLDGRSDLFALGILLYEMISGTNPFSRKKVFDQLQAIQTDEPAPLGSVCPEWAPIDGVLSLLLAKDPARRFDSAGAAAEALSNLQQAYPRPPGRLGGFVSGHFGGELSELASAITDSKIRAALQPTQPRLSVPQSSAGPLLEQATLLKLAPARPGGRGGPAPHRAGPGGGFRLARGWALGTVCLAAAVLTAWLAVHV